MSNTMFFVLFSLGLYMLGVYVLPDAIDREFANQDAAIERHIEFVENNNPYK